MRARKAFTLVELVVVIMIMGILAAVAAPKFLNTSAKATDNGLKQTLGVVRDAIELHAAENGGELPGASDNTQATFKADLASYLRKDFPKCPVGHAQNDQVRIKTNAGVMQGVANPVQGWHYSVLSGEFICNCGEVSSDGVTQYDAF